MNDYEQLVAMLAENQKTTNLLLEKALAPTHEKTLTNSMTANKLHGLDGLWSTTTERDVITAHIRSMGMASQIPLLPSVDEDPRFGILTGYTDVNGTEPTAACQDAPSAFVKGCTATARFGMLRRDTNEIEINKVMLKRNRGDFTDLMLRGQVLGLSGMSPQGLDEAGILNIVTKSEMVTAAIAGERELVRQFWQGAWGTGTEFPGLDAQIATGHVDAETNVACPAVDSDVKDFAYDDVAGGGRSIVEYLSMLEWYLYFNAQRMGLLPMSAAIVMRPELWQVLTEVWPCQYNTNKCASSVLGTASRVVIDGRENIAQRDSMRSGMTIEINGRSYPVIIDDGIYEANSTNDANLTPGQYASTIYFVPLTITGNFPVLYREYVDYRNAFVGANAAFLNGREDFWSDDGVYLWSFQEQLYCYKLALKTEQRIILRTPQLAGKIQNVMYEPLQHLRSSDATSPYFADGGLSLRNTDDSFYAVWA
ncbi:hypothetical protein E2P63_02515 [Candidatus Bathyarchaeota archaeon]|nr:hypothetical protein E2P63_02515 [Candidatus Bathyarchaeota archaeon]